jgi:hypothetical protein
MQPLQFEVSFFITVKKVLSFEKFSFADSIERVNSRTVLYVALFLLEEGHQVHI